MQDFNFAKNFKPKRLGVNQETNLEVETLSDFEERVKKSKEIIKTNSYLDYIYFNITNYRRLTELSEYNYARKESELINTPSQLKKLANKLMKVSEFALDTETNTLRVYAPDRDNPNPLVCITISFGENFNYYIPVAHLLTTGNLPKDLILQELQPVFNRLDLKLYLWNSKFDMHVLETFGLKIATSDIFDGMIASWLLNVNTPNGLKHNTEELLGIPQNKINTVFSTVNNIEKKAIGLKSNSTSPFSLVRVHAGAPYALDDSYFTYVNCKILEKRLVENDFMVIYDKMYKPFIKVLFTMERAGMCVDVDKLQQMQKDMNKDLEDLEFSLLSLAGVQLNLGSPQQLAEILFGYDKSKNPNKAIIENSFEFPVESVTAKGSPSTDSTVLKHLSKRQYKINRKNEGVEFCSKLLEYKKLQKLKTAFVDGILDKLYADSRVHPSFNIIGTTSGRISCSAPNLMQLPNAGDEDKYQIRDVFIGDIDEATGIRDHIISVDFSNLEMRVLAHFSEDPNLCETFREERDAHGDTAVKMFRLDCTSEEVKKKYKTERNIAKTINFLLMYGGSALTLYDSLKESGVDMDSKEICTKEKVKNGKELAQKYYDKYFETYKGVAKYIRNQKKVARQQAYVETLVGRRRDIPEMWSRHIKDISYGERLSVNSVIQGSGADLMINSQIKIYENKRLKELKCKMLVQIHDELLFSCPESNCEEAIEIISDIMKHPLGKDVALNVPLNVGAGHSKSYQGGH